jgi:SSS family solute:Na+ symporter
MVHKFYTIKNEKSIKSGTIISTVFAVIISGGCYFLGGFGRLYDNEVIYKADGSIAFDAVVPHMLSSLPDVLIGIVVVLVLSASMSTLASLVMTSSSTLTLDFIKGNLVKNMSEKKQILTMRVLIVGFIALSVFIAMDPPTFIAQLMGISWGALAGSFLAPFLYGLYWKRVTKAAVWASFAAGVGITVSNLFLKYIASPINAGAIAMIAGLVVVPIVSMLTPKMDQGKLCEVFSCYDETVTVHTRKSIEEA